MLKHLYILWALLFPINVFAENSCPAEAPEYPTAALMGQSPEQIATMEAKAKALVDGSDGKISFGDFSKCAALCNDVPFPYIHFCYLACFNHYCKNPSQTPFSGSDKRSSDANSNIGKE